MPSDKSYNAQYWKANRKRLLAERAHRYREDKKFRAEAIARSRARVALDKILRSVRVAVVEHDGHIEKRRTFSELCKAADRSKDVLYRWREQGILPQPTFRDARGNGVYAESQLAYVRALCQMIDNDSLRIDYSMFGKVLHKFWTKSWSNEDLGAYLDKEVRRGCEKEGCDFGKKESRKTRSGLDDHQRGDQAEEGKTEAVRRGARSGSRQHGKHSEHGKLSESAPRRRSRAALLTCGGRRSFREGR